MLIKKKGEGYGKGKDRKIYFPTYTSSPHINN